MSGPDAPPEDCRVGLQHAAATAVDPVLLVRAGDPPRLAWFNAAAADLLARDPATAAGLPVHEVLTWSEEVQLLQQERGRHHEGVLTGADGEAHPVQLRAHPVPGHDLWAVTAASRPDGECQVHAAAAHAFERRFLALTEQTPVPTVLSDVGLRLAHVNDAFTRLVGLPAESLLGTGWLGLLDDGDLPAVTRCAQQALEGEESDVVVAIRSSTGTRRLVHLRLAPAHTRGHGPSFVGTAEDVTERLAFEQQLAYQATHDALTGLPNRAALFDHLQATLAREGGRLRPAVLFLDLDDFKTINDSLGHDAGDSMLVDIARRLRGAVRDGDVVTRMGGDEFVVVCQGVRDEAEAEVMAGRVLAVCTRPLTVNGVRVHPSASMGVALAGPGHTTAQDLLRDADIAMYEAKARGKNRFTICDDATRSAARDTLQLLADLREAIATGAITVVYQPVVDMRRATGARGPLPAVEALARWTHPVRGAVPPQEFVALAERHQLIDALTSHVLDAACAQLARWRDELGDLAPGRVNVNLSAVQLGDPRVVTTVTDALHRHRVPASSLCVEITESAIMIDPVAARSTLVTLREIGVAVAIDDFGMGYSSLAYLQRLPVDHLKIDRSFVSEIGHGGGALAEAVISLARALGLSAIAEGVEEQQQADRLQELGCDLAQGWLWAPGLSGAELGTWVRGLSRGIGIPA